MNLIIDVGNTRTKVAVFSDDDQLLSIDCIDNSNTRVEALLENKDYKKALISTVKAIDFQMPERKNVILFDVNTRLPVKNSYKSKTIGTDRLAAVVSAYYQSGRANCVVFDLGSAITIDFVDSSGVYIGGNISPGMKMRFLALNNFTDNLPLVEASSRIDLTSQTTIQAINSGVVKSIVFEMESYIASYEKVYPQLEIFLTGGDAIFFAKQLKKRIFADEKLVLKGLNRILNYNVK